MIKHRKIIICILLCYALFIIGIFNVNAKTIDTWVSGNNTSTYGALNCQEYAGMESCFRSGISYQNNTQFTFLLGNTNSVTNADVFVTIYTPYDYNDNASVNISLQDGGICFLQGVYHSGWNNYKCSNVTGRLIFVVSKGTGYGGSGTGVIGVARLITYYEYLDNTTITNNTSDINNKISDSSIDTNNTTSSTTSWGNKNASNGTITNLLTLPISLLQAIVNGIQSSCSSFSLGSLFGTNITLPCINIGSLIGSSLWSTIDILFSGFMILAIAKKLIKIFNDFTNLKTNQVDELYGGGK